MTHTEKQIADYEAAIRVMETLPKPDNGRPGACINDYYQIGCESQRNFDLQELRRRLEVMRKWRPGMRMQHRPVNTDDRYWVKARASEPSWEWRIMDYRPAPSPAKPGVVWMRPRTVSQTAATTFIPHDYVFSPVMPDGPGWTRYTIAEEGQQ